jgi:hypothetical protein
MTDERQRRAEYYHRTAEEIGQFARQSRFPQIGEELFRFADRFDRLAAHLERQENAGQEAPPGRKGIQHPC